jgi:cytochrome b6-f complex iron-sulfur subunit
MTTTRRVFLKVIGAGAGALSVGGLPLACGGPADGPVDAGNVADLDEGTLAKVEGAGVLVGRDAGGVYAMTAICTHLGCDMSTSSGEIDGDTLTCNCHGSTYDLSGGNTGGPASAPLKHWKVEIGDDGAITVQVGTEVGDDERAAVPA